MRINPYSKISETMNVKSDGKGYSENFYNFFQKPAKKEKKKNNENHRDYKIIQIAKIEDPRVHFIKNLNTYVEKYIEIIVLKLEDSNYEADEYFYGKEKIDSIENTEDAVECFEYFVEHLHSVIGFDENIIRKNIIHSFQKSIKEKKVSRNSERLFYRLIEYFNKKNNEKNL
ncbi:MAG: hypothetical protein H7A30_03160 [Thermotogae bacterium]|nr:hypothetical protein [Thermotogota bacterium]